MNRWAAAAAAVVLVPLLAYPALTVAGGAPRFPSRAECVRAAMDGKPVEVVFARSESLAEATDVGDRVIAVGFVGTEVVPDGCGLWKVALDGVPSLEVGREVQEEAESVDFHPTLELDPDG